jgi:hypothetical protein
VRFPAAIVISALVMIASLPGCDRDSSKDGPPFEPSNIDGRESLSITKSDIEAAGSSTPYAAVLLWWQALQRKRPQTVKRSYPEPISGDKAKRQIRRFKHRYSLPIEPKVDTNGNQATVNVTVRTARRSDEAPNVVSINEFGANFPLLRESDGWRLRPVAYRRYIERRKTSHPPPIGG